MVLAFPWLSGARTAWKLWKASKPARFEPIATIHAGLHPTPQLASEGWDISRWPNFRPTEMSCNCQGRFCLGEYWHDEHLLDALQTMRNTIGKPLKINSGHRCRQWNAVVGGAPRSKHKAIAVDIALEGHDPKRLLDAARLAGFTGLGLHASFLHLDGRNAPAAWSYGATSRRLWESVGVTFGKHDRHIIGLPPIVRTKELTHG